jgi:hypothetical protein
VVVIEPPPAHNDDVKQEQENIQIVLSQTDIIFLNHTDSVETFRQALLTHSKLRNEAIAAVQRRSDPRRGLMQYIAPLPENFAWLPYYVGTYSNKLNVEGDALGRPRLHHIWCIHFYNNAVAKISKAAAKKADVQAEDANLEELRNSGKWHPVTWAKTRKTVDAVNNDKRWRSGVRWLPALDYGRIGVPLVFCKNCIRYRNARPRENNLAMRMEMIDEAGMRAYAADPKKFSVDPKSVVVDEKALLTQIRAEGAKIVDQMPEERDEAMYVTPRSLRSKELDLDIETIAQFYVRGYIGPDPGAVSGAVHVKKREHESTRVKAMLLGGERKYMSRGVLPSRGGGGDSGA